MNELEVINFQGHLQSYLEFHKGVNIIRGTSHHGKSALIRAIRWAIENEPRGAKFRNWDKKAKDGVEAHLSFNYGSVSRVNRSGFNGYLTRQEDVSGGYAHEEEFEALRGDVPREVEIISGMDGTNIWGQDDGYFLLQESPGNVARRLNERSGLEDIDRVAKIAKGMIADYEQKLKFAEEGLMRAEDRRDYLASFRKHKETIEEIDSFFKQSDSIAHNKKDLESRIETIREFTTAIEKQERILASASIVEELDKLLDRRLKVSSRNTSLRLSMNNIDEISTYLEHLDLELASEKYVDEIIKLGEERFSLIQQYNKLDGIRSNIVALDQEIKIQQNMIESLDIHINELMEPIEELESCPTCGALKEHWKHEILNNG